MDISIARDQQEEEAHLRSFTDRLFAPHQWTAGASPSYEKSVTCVIHPQVIRHRYALVLES